MVGAFNLGAGGAGQGHEQVSAEPAQGQAGGKCHVLYPSSRPEPADTPGRWQGLWLGAPRCPQAPCPALPGVMVPAMEQSQGTVKGAACHLQPACYPRPGKIAAN